MEKEKCDCGNIAVWDYLPGYSNGGNSYSCEDCVPRGCSCNWIPTKTKSSKFKDGALKPEGIENLDWKYVDFVKAKEEGFEMKQNEYFVYLDSQQRENPCGEYWYDKDGFDKD